MGTEGRRRKKKGEEEEEEKEEGQMGGAVLLSQWDPVSGSPVAMGKLLTALTLYSCPHLCSDCRVDPP